MKPKHLILPAAIAFAATAIAPAAAQQVPLHPALQDRWSFGAGVFFPSTATQASLTSNSTGLGTSIDFEDTFGMKRSDTVPTAYGRWRINQRWRIDAEYFQLNRSSERVIDREINWGDQTFPVNTSVSSKFDFSDLRVSAGYSFFRTPDKELGVGLGLHMAWYDVSLNSPSGGGEGQDVLAPLPVLSVYGNFALTDRWAVGTRLDRFSLSYDKFTGSLTNLALDLQYQPFRHVGFAFGYRGLFIKAEVEDDRVTGKFRQSFSGPMLSMNVSW
jgi:hypothetical protein